MLWQLAQIQFCDDKHLLWRDGVQIQLEPKQAEVLAYFCRHPGRLISRDEFIAEVWQGQIVTDNAINRIIAKLRKSLGDPAKHSEFIITLPRKGYRLIAPVALATIADRPLMAVTANALDLAAAEIAAQPKLNHSPAIGRWLMLVLLLAIGLGFSYWQAMPSQNQPTSFKLTPLTRESGEELLPALAPDGRSLIYSAEYSAEHSANQQPNLALYLKDLISNEITLLSKEAGYSGNGDWSRDGLRFAYFYQNANSCQIKLLEFQPNIAEKPTNTADQYDAAKKILQHKVVHQCPVGSHGNVAFSHDGNTLIYSENQGTGTAYHIYLKNLTTGDIRQPAQPPLVLAGNVEFDLHPRLNQLLISSPNQHQQLSYYLLDIPSNQLKHLFSKNNWFCCPIWDQQGETILQTDASPSNQLLQFGLDGQQLATIFSTGHGIGKLRRAGDGQSYVYSGWQARREIHVQPLSGGLATTLIASSVSDSLPKISQRQQFLAFVSDRSGSREIWLHQLDNGHNRKLSEFNRNDWIYDLQWSPDDRQLAVLFGHEIQLLDIASGHSQTLAIPVQEIRGLSWVNQHTLAFSLQQQQRWQLFHYDLGSDQLLQQPSDWAYAQYDALTQRGLLMNQQLQFMLAGQPLAIQLPGITDRSRRFYFSFSAGKLYFLQQKPDAAKAQLLQSDIATGVATIIAEMPANTQFSIGRNGLYFTVDKTPEADIFQLSPAQ
ncbi:hypothetical protein A5320_01410 [Rheinheimera sp. SA_1]|uniref:winged helix-turn-helix domain-containing protein n=1 Tax=Rheinheimera sp. SA_1 TaxID=1827365 RepID=UPI0007FE1F87|nr:winged helix-turn-helix domain-containing protein [Rheinheimera sp. SA_1]OBP16108.1 hypothetical protein A5320_01410 [Rheinheimera sp. SA_1]